MKVVLKVFQWKTNREEKKPSWDSPYLYLEGLFICNGDWRFKSSLTENISKFKQLTFLNFFLPLLEYAFMAERSTTQT